MAYVTPASEVWLIKDCPLDVGREHTYLFPDEEGQLDYFHDNSRATHHWGDYVRINPLDNTIRLGLPYKDVYQCNYVSFKNAATLQEQKWYYAFITECNYINEGTTEIVFDLDYMQTYMFDFEMSPCMIEREHTKTDAVGDNIVPEGLDIGEYVINKTHKNGNTTINPNGYIPCKIGNDIVYIIITSFDLLQSMSRMQVYQLSDYKSVGKMYSGVGVFVCVDDAALFLSLELINNMQQADSIAAVFPFPACLINWNCLHRFDISTYTYVWTDGSTGTIFRLYDEGTASCVQTVALHDNIVYPTSIPFSDRDGFYIPKIKNEQIDGYTPWNNKLYTAPFCWVELDTKTGQTALYRPELFGASIDFEFATSPTAEPQIFAYPLNYRGITKNMEEGITKADAYPYCAWQYDNYAVWLRENSASLALSFAMGAINAIAGATSAAIGRTASTLVTKNVSGEIPSVSRARDARGRFTGGYTYEGKSINRTEITKRVSQYNTNPAEVVRGFTNGISGCAGALASMAEHSMVPDTVRGQVNNGSINQANGINDFWVYIKTVRGDYAQKIDDYFSRYGYAVNRFGLPGVINNSGALINPQSAPRPRWNYVKTIDCKVHGRNGSAFAHIVEENLESIFNNGVTFWTLGTTQATSTHVMYNYTQTALDNNRPTV